MHVGCMLSEQVKNFVKASSSVLISPDNITFILSNMGFSLQGNWSYNFKKWIVSFSDCGSFTFLMSGVSISLSAKLGLDSTGHPTIWSTGCSCSISSLSINLSGGASWIYNLLIGFVKESIWNQLQTKICEAAKTAINRCTKEWMTSFPLQMTVFSDLLFDYRFLSAPDLQNGFLDTKHKAAFVYKDNTTEPPILVRTF